MMANHSELLIAIWRDLQWREELLGVTKWSPSGYIGQVGPGTNKLMWGLPYADDDSSEICLNCTDLSYSDR